jgi:hypothetical protein
MSVPFPTPEGPVMTNTRATGEDPNVESGGTVSLGV